MPTGQPDPRFLPQERSDVGGGGAEGDEGGRVPQESVGAIDVVEAYADHLIREAMEAGEFDDLQGTGKPIPGAGTVDDDMWWIRSWLKRNRASGDQEADQHRVDNSSGGPAPIVRASAQTWCNQS